MDTIFSITFLISLIMLILGLVKPTLSIFWRKQRRTRKSVLMVYGISLILSFAFIGISSEHSLTTPNAPSKQSDNNIEVNDLKKLYSEDEIILIYQSIWDSTKLTTGWAFPNFGDYVDSLRSILLEIEAISSKYPKAKKLHSKLIKSEKMRSATKDFIIYGQPLMESDLILPCEFYIESRAKNPRSINFIESRVVGRTKFGWKVQIKYQGQNSFGAIVTEFNSFDVRHSEQETFYVYRAY